jgi:zinc/manganese transport system substrate-binding protein
MKNAKRLILSRLVSVFLVIVGSTEAATLRVVASTGDLAAVAREVGGDQISIEFICRPDQDPHSFEILPRQVLLVQQADVYLKVGVGLDLWTNDLIRSAGNAQLIVADCSEGIEIIEHAAANNEGESHVHPAGNPHYNLGPENLRRVAQTIRDALMRADSGRTELFLSGYSAFIARLDSSLAAWRETLVPCRETGIVSTHAEWDYFARDFGLKITGIVSPVPDAEPTPAHLAQLEQAIRATGRCVFLKEPFASDRIPQVLARDTGIPVITVPPAVGAMLPSTDVWSHFGFIVRELAAHCGGK